MAFRDMYPKGEGIQPLYGDATDQYLTGLERVPVFNASDELAKKPVEATEQVLDAAAEAIRRMEVLRRQLCGIATRVEGAFSNPEFVSKLSEELRASGIELISHLEDLDVPVSPPTPPLRTNGRKRSTL